MRSLAVNGTEIRYVDRGNGLPLVLIHGFPLDHTMWTDLIDALAGASQGCVDTSSLAGLSDQDPCTRPARLRPQSARANRGRQSDHGPVRR